MLRSLRCLCLLAGVAVPPAVADIDPAQYQLKSSVRSDAERSRLLAELQAERQREAQALRQQEDVAARQRAAREAARAALPHPVRLTEDRCTVCHGEENYARKRHNRVGWEMVILRMQHLNGAPLAAGERGVIAAHLAQVYAPSGAAAAIELLQQLAAALTPLWLAIAWKAVGSRSTTPAGKTLVAKPGVFR